MLCSAEYLSCLLVTLAGLLVGSFLNVVIWRLPIMLQRQWHRAAADTLGQTPGAPQPSYNLLTPGSRCPYCNQPIRAWQNIPILSFLLQRGRCAVCQSRIAWYYPGVELVSALLALGMVMRFGMTLQSFWLTLFCWNLLVLAVIDLRTRLLPDVLTLPLLWGGLLASALQLVPGPSPTEAIIGAAAGYLTLWVLGQAFHRLTGRIGMGHGDFKLAAALGAWLGWRDLPQVFLLAAIGGLLASVLLILSRRMRRNEALPFGPWLALGGWLTLNVHDTMLHLS